VQQALLSIKFKSWPFDGRIAVKEYSPESQKTELHVFDQWRHIDTLKSEDELYALSTSKQTLAFDLDTYHLLAKHIAKNNLDLINI
jgi:DNA polymerase-3 subunit epsilon